MLDFIPEYIKKILKMLDENDFAGYVVGGAVRDFLLDLQPKDFDVCTNAVPEQVVKLAHKYNYKVIENLGQNFGVVMLVIDGFPVEVATFRGEKYGLDSHKPQEVTFCQTIEDDLSRRDFTINAMAITKEGKIIDPYNGQQDLTNGILRTVGDAQMRFAEDGLRMFRACRFCSRFGFVADDKLLLGIKEQKARVRGLSMERVKIELEKILCAPFVDVGLQMLVDCDLAQETFKLKIDGKEQDKPILPELKNFLNNDKWQELLQNMQTIENDLLLRWSILFYYLLDKHDKVADVLQRFSYNEKFITKVTWLVKNSDTLIKLSQSKEIDTKNWLIQEARSKYFHNNQELNNLLENLKKISLVLDSNLDNNAMDNILAMAQKMPVHTSDLAITGAEVLQIMPDKSKIGEVLKHFLLQVQEGKILNEKNILQDKIAEYMKIY